MFEAKVRAYATIPENLMLSRLAQSEQIREFFIQMWMQNPALARQGGVRVQNLLTPLVVYDEVVSRNFPAGFTADREGVEK
jgi:hypothetical protein